MQRIEFDLYSLKSILVLTTGPVAPLGPLSPALPDSPCQKEHTYISIDFIFMDENLNAKVQITDFLLIS